MFMAAGPRSGRVSGQYSMKRASRLMTPSSTAVSQQWSLADGAGPRVAWGLDSVASTDWDLESPDLATTVQHLWNVTSSRLLVYNYARESALARASYLAWLLVPLLTVVRWMTPVVFADPNIEAEYLKWWLTTSSRPRRVSHGVAGFLLVGFAGSNILRSVVLAPTAYMVFVLLVVGWLGCGWVLWRGPQGALWVPHAVAVIDTVSLVLVLVVSMSCNGWAWTFQCSLLEAGSLHASQILAMVTLMMVEGVGLQLQAPWIVCHVMCVYLTWLLHVCIKFPVPMADCVVITLGLVLLLLLVACQSYLRHRETRQQYQAMMDLAQQLRINSSATRDLRVAHEVALHERGKAVRATTAREIHEAIMGYTCHELRNPLHGIRGNLEELISRARVGHTIDEQDIRNMNHMEAAVVAMAQVTDDVVDFYKLQSGTLSLKRSATSIHATIEQAINCSCPQSRSVIDVAVDAAVPAIVETDGARVAQVIAIGLSNAVKFMKPDTHVQVKCMFARMNELDQSLSSLPEAGENQEAASSGAHSPAFVQIEVWNEGEGLGTVDLKQLFEPYGGKPGDSAVPRGFGMGLPIGRMLVEALGGQVGLEDRDRHTVFWFRIPLVVQTLDSGPVVIRHAAGGTSLIRRPSAWTLLLPTMQLTSEKPWLYWVSRPPVARVVTEARSLHVLVVDDLSTNRRLLSSMLRKLGYMSTELEDGDQVLGLLQDSSRHVDACLLDIHMVRTDGRDVARLLRQQGYVLPLIATTGNVTSSDIASYRDAQFDGVLGKPFSTTHLAALLQEVFGTGPLSPTPSQV